MKFIFSCFGAVPFNKDMSIYAEEAVIRNPRLFEKILLLIDDFDLFINMCKLDTTTALFTLENNRVKEQIIKKFCIIVKGTTAQFILKPFSTNKKRCFYWISQSHDFPMFQYFPKVVRSMLCDKYSNYIDDISMDVYNKDHRFVLVYTGNHSSLSLTFLFNSISPNSVNIGNLDFILRNLCHRNLSENIVLVCDLKHPKDPPTYLLVGDWSP